MLNDAALRSSLPSVVGVRPGASVSTLVVPASATTTARSAACTSMGRAGGAGDGGTVEDEAHHALAMAATELAGERAVDAVRARLGDGHGAAVHLHACSVGGGGAALQRDRHLVLGGPDEIGADVVVGGVLGERPPRRRRTDATVREPVDAVVAVDAVTEVERAAVVAGRGGLGGRGLLAGGGELDGGVRGIRRGAGSQASAATPGTTRTERSRRRSRNMGPASSGAAVPGLAAAGKSLGGGTPRGWPGALAGQAVDRPTTAPRLVGQPLEYRPRTSLAMRRLGRGGASERTTTPSAGMSDHAEISARVSSFASVSVPVPYCGGMTSPDSVSRVARSRLSRNVPSARRRSARRTKTEVRR